VLPPSCLLRQEDCHTSLGGEVSPPASCLLPPAVGGRRQEAGRRNQPSSSYEVRQARLILDFFYLDLHFKFNK